MTTVKIKGMSCQHCVASTTQALEGVAGVSNVQVDLDKGEARYEGDVDSKTIKEAIEKIGFEVVE
jgi:copper chaperone CopZ